MPMTARNAAALASLERVSTLPPMTFPKSLASAGLERFKF
jgi:hypothetical protein